MNNFYLMKKNGFTIIQALIVSGILSFLGLVMISTMKGVFNEGMKTRIISRQTELETRILTALRNPGTYSDAQKNEMKLGGAPSQLDIRDQKNRLVATIGQIQYLQLDGRPCSSSKFGTGICRLSAEFNINCGSVGSPVPCKAAYRIAGKYDKNNTFSNLGVKTEGPFNLTTDYDVTIPYDIYGGKQNPGECINANGFLAATGFQRDTGELKCVKKPQTSCAPQTVGKRIKYEPTTNTLEMNCVPSTNLSCPSNYLLTRFVPSTTVKDGAIPTGSCVFIGVKSVPWASTSGEQPANPTNPGSYIYGRFCPEHYTAVPTCTVVNISAKSKKCGTCECECTGEGATRKCKTCGGNTLDPVPGSCSYTVYGTDVEASIQIPVQPKCPCGPGRPSWDAKIQLSGQCQLAEPEEVGAL